MRDALRGRITGRLDIERRLATSGLPVPAQELIARVVRRTRLWRIEKADVAQELIAHFADGLEEGETIETMIGRFGDERAAAKLIRRAKRRNRPLAWHAMVFLRRAILAIVIAYALLAVYYFSGQPTPKVDYVAQWNQRIAATPADERAWPLYRRAIVAIKLEPYATIDHPWMIERLDARPGDGDWPEIAAWLKRHAESLELARQASQKPSLGFALGVGEAGEDPAMIPAGSPKSGVEPSQDSPLLALRTTHLVALSALAEALAADAHLARREGDGARTLRDIAALNRMAEQIRDQELLPSIKYYLFSIRDLAIDVAFDAATGDGPPLEAAQLAQLAHLFAEPDEADEIVSFAGARRLLDDYAQRMYTDDGSGDGRLTTQGLQMIPTWPGGGFLPRDVRKWSFYFPDPQAAIDRFLAGVGPTLPLVVLSRRDFTGAADRMMELAETNLSRPMREANWDAWYAQRRAWRASPLDEVKYAPLLALLPNAESTQARAERLLGRRDGLLVAIALELFRREHGRYPQALDELSPALLPSIPVDRVSGAPLRYRLIDGRPTVYSVGLDRDDDGGQPPLSARGEPIPWRAAAWELPPDRYPDGDWVLYPQRRRNSRHNPS